VRHTHWFSLDRLLSYLGKTFLVPQTDELLNRRWQAFAVETILGAAYANGILYRRSSPNRIIPRFSFNRQSLAKIVVKKPA
jgi:hypothetical protein